MFIGLCLLGGAGARRAGAYLPPAYGGSLTAPLPDLPLSLEPAQASRESELQVISLLYDTLLTIDAGGAPAPHLIESPPQISADGKIWRLGLRSGVHLSSGRALLAADVVASLRRAKGGPHGHLLAAVRAIEAEGTSVVILRLWRRAPELAWRLCAPASAIAVPAGKLGAPVGTGAFRLHRRSAAQLHLKANTGHFAGRPFLDDLKLVVFERASAEVATFQVGGAQISLRGTSVFGGRPRHPTSDLESSVVSTVFLGVGRGRAYLADPAFRLALLRGIDRRRLGRLVGTGRAEVADGPVSRWLLHAQPRTIAFDRVAAARLLGQLAARHRELGELARGGRIKLGLLIDASRHEDAVVAGQIVADLDRLGIAATVEARPAAAYQVRLAQGSYELVLGRLPLQVSQAAVTLASALAAAGEKRAAQRCLASGSCGAREAAAFMRQLPLLPLVHTTLRIFHDARLGAVRFTAGGRIAYDNMHWIRGTP